MKIDLAVLACCISFEMRKVRKTKMLTFPAPTYNTQMRYSFQNS